MQSRNFSFFSAAAAHRKVIQNDLKHLKRVFEHFSSSATAQRVFQLKNFRRYGCLTAFRSNKLQLVKGQKQPRKEKMKYDSKRDNYDSSESETERVGREKAPKWRWNWVFTLSLLPHLLHCADLKNLRAKHRFVGERRCRENRASMLRMARGERRSRSTMHWEWTRKRSEKIETIKNIKNS